MHQATLRLFKAIQIPRRAHKAPDPAAMKLTIPFGFVLDPDIRLGRNVLKSDVFKTANNLFGISGKQANATFHKSWEKVRSEDIEKLILEQLVHYLTTYGYASIGQYDPSTVFIPHEKLDLPQVSDDIRLIHVRGLTAVELLDEIIKLGSGVALQEQSLDDIMDVIVANQYTPDFLARIKNHELLARLYDHYDLVPDEPVAFLRYLVYRITDTSLLIKNDELLGKIKEAKRKRVRLLDQLIEKSPQDLASIFYRFKPIFLALKSISKNKTFFNRLRKKAIKQHQPAPEDYLNSITQQIKQDVLDFNELARRVGQATVFRKIRLAQALQFRTTSCESVVYSIRNGRGWGTQFHWPAQLQDVTRRALEIVVDSFIADLRKNVNGKNVFIPPYVNYALPSSEKQFAGPFPVGSFVSTVRDTVFGVHWFNVNGRPTDLDLSLLTADGKVGWDAEFRNEEALFSGDVTDAPRPQGGTELFHVKNGVSPNLVLCNYYNYSANSPVEAKIIVAQEAPDPLTMNYMVDINRIVAKADITINRKQTILGLVLTVDGQTRFHFGNVGVGHSITAMHQDHSEHARRYYTDRFTDILTLKSALESAGANVVSVRPDNGDFVDLSPNNLTKTSITSLFLRA